jgi:DNA-binding NarL/FixJ family response regulator
MLRILVADEHPVVREGLYVHLAARSGWEVVAEAADGEEAIVKAVETQPNVAVLELALPLMNGIEATREIRTRLSKTEVVIFTRHNVENLLGLVNEAGARGCVLKSEPTSHLVEAIQLVARRRPYYSSLIPDASKGTKSALTNREREIVRLVADGYCSKGIAAALGISFRTVETHRATVVRKLELDSCADLVRYAVRNQIVVG